MLPEAFIVHQMDGRLRLKIPAHKGEDAFFNDLRNQLIALKRFDRVTVNPATGSILLEQSGLEADALPGLMAAEQICDLKTGPEKTASTAEQFAAPLGTMNQKIRDFTGGDLGLPEAVFICLVLFGLYEIAKGNFKRPPWYTAFWYAFGLFSKTVIDRTVAKHSSGK